MKPVTQGSKKKYTILQLVTALITGTAFFLSAAWPFFRFIVCAGEKKKKGQSVSRKKWFSLKHTTINHPKYRFAKEYEETKKWCESQPMRDWYIRSADGLKLHASYLDAEKPKRLVVLCHGYRGTRFGSVAHMAKFFHENGCALLFMDQRCCGESEGRYITFGAKEQEDLRLWLKRLNRENRQGLPVYLYGQSMGAATVLLAAAHPLTDNVRGLIADCGFHSMKQQLRDIASGWFHLPWIGLLLLRIELFCRVVAGFSMKDTDTSTALKNNRLPVLFFHGEDDTYVLPENSVRNYSLCKAHKEIVLVPGARHLCSSYVAPQICRKKIMRFFTYCEQPSA